MVDQTPDTQAATAPKKTVRRKKKKTQTKKLAEKKPTAKKRGRKPGSKNKLSTKKRGRPAGVKNKKTPKAKKQKRTYNKKQPSFSDNIETLTMKRVGSVLIIDAYDGEVKKILIQGSKIKPKVELV